MIEQHPVTDDAKLHPLRRFDVTGSVVPALPRFDKHPRLTPLGLYTRKRWPDLEIPERGNKVTERGTILEPAVAVAARMQRPHWKIAAANTYYRDPDLRFGATPDFLVDDNGLRGVLQAKTVARHVYEREWLDGTEVPTWILLQTLAEAMLTEAAFAAVAVMVVDPFDLETTIFDVPRHPVVERSIRQGVAEFWDDVAHDREPTPDYSRDDAVIRLLHPSETKGKTLDLSGNNELPELLAHRAALAARIKRDQGICDAIESQVRHMMGDAESANGLDGWRISYKTSHRSAYTVPEKDIRTLRITDKRPAEQRPDMET